MKGIVLAGGKGSRLYPMTKAVSKPLIPIYDKPMIYYPLSVLLTAGIRQIMIISSPADIDSYKRLLGTGEELGVEFTYGVQYVARGIADAFLIAEDFLGGDRVCLVLGDNLFYGAQLETVLHNAVNNKAGATVFGYPVKNPHDYGVVEFDDQLNVVSIEEKPASPKSNYAVPGLYFYDAEAIDIAKHIHPSARGELEITAVNEEYLRKGRLKVELMGRGMAWLDTGTPTGMLQAAEYVEAVQSRQGLYIACLEEVAYSQGFISRQQLYRLGEALKMTEYGQYLMMLAAK